MFTIADRSAADDAAPQRCRAARPVSTGTDAGRWLASQWRLVERVGSERGAVESFIARCFEASFSARIEAFMPRLLSLSGPGRAIAGAAGLRCAGHRLFVENYLDEAIECAIGRHAGRRVARGAIVEVGHLCGSFEGATRLMIALLAPLLHGEGFSWVAFAGTPRLRNAFARVGMVPVDIGAAAAERLPQGECARWGRYYEFAPRVMIGRIEDGLAALEAGARGGVAPPGRRA